MLDVRSEFGDEGHMTGLPQRALRAGRKGESERLVIREDGELPPLQEVTEVFYS